MPADASLHIRLLGSFQVTVDGRPVEERNWSRRKPKLLVKLLALQANHQLHREQAMELLWPEADPESSANNLHKAIHLARHALEPELKSGSESRFIHTHGQQISLSAAGGLSIDAEAFERKAAEAVKGADAAELEAALDLYAGDLLPEDLYEDWAGPRRTQLRSLYFDVLARLASLHETQASYENAIECLKRLVSSDPPNEEAHRNLMRLYAQSGSKHLALRQYRECAEALKRESDVTPDAATMALHDRIIAGQIPVRNVARENSVGVLQPTPPVESAQRQRLRTTKWLAAAALSATLLFVMALYLLPKKPQTIDSVAVLPLVNEARDPEVDYLADGITDSLIGSLSQLPGLKVMAHSTVFSYKNRDLGPRTIGEELGVHAVLTGRVSQRNDRLMIRMELVEVGDGALLWGEQYDAGMSGILAVQEEISRNVSRKLRLKLTGADERQLVKRYTASVEAYHLYLKGRYHWNKRTVDGLRRSIEYFDQAIAKDSRYALAYAGLADAYTLLGAGDYAAMAPREAMSKAKMAAIEALEIDSSLAEAHTSLAFLNYIFDWDWTGAEEHYKRAIELNPNYETAHHWYSLYLTAMLRPDEAIRHAQEAQTLSPLSLIINTDLGVVLHRARRYDQAIEQFRKTLEIEPNFGQARWHLGRTFVQKGMFDEAIVEFQKAISEERSPVYLASLGHAYGLAGRKDQARKILSELTANRAYVLPSLVAMVYIGLDQKDQAFAWLNKAFEERSDYMVVLKVDPMLDDLRNDPRFADLMKRTGLAPL